MNPQTMRNLSTVLFGVGLLFLGACYRYVPAEMAAVPLGSDVRAHLTGDGVEAMRSSFGPDVHSVEGPLVEWDEEGVGVLTEMYLSRPGFPATTLTDTVRLLPHHLAGVEMKKLDRKRTAGFTAVVVGGMAAALWAGKAFGGSSDDNGEGGGPDPEASVIFRIPISLPFNIPFNLGFR